MNTPAPNQTLCPVCGQYATETPHRTTDGHRILNCGHTTAPQTHPNAEPTQTPTPRPPPVLRRRTSQQWEDLYTDGLGHCFSDADPGL